MYYKKEKHVSFLGEHSILYLVFALELLESKSMSKAAYKTTALLQSLNKFWKLKF